MKELFKKYLKRECSAEEIQQIVSYLRKSEKLSDFPTYDEVSKILETYPDIDENVSNRIYRNILKENLTEATPVKKLPLFWKYAVAAVFIGLITTGYFFKDNLSPDKTILLADNDFQPGNNKAILTLADGSVVHLEKGNSYEDKGVNSDGQKIVYDQKSNQSIKTEYNYLTIPRGGEFFVKLSDGTQVWLNSESQLKYPTNFEKGETRVVELVYGEAYFDVSPSTSNYGAKFMVLNNSQEIEVLGTEFNVRAYKGDVDICTTLVEGKVKVSSDKLSQVLKPSQQVLLNINDHEFSEVRTVNVYNEISWKEGVFSFRRKSFLEIAKVLSRWYDVEVHFENKEFESKGFNGVLGKDQSLTEILENFKGLKAINDYEINNKTIMIK